MWYHPAAHKLAWHDVAGAWLACAVIVISAIGFVNRTEQSGQNWAEVANLRRIAL